MPDRDWDKELSKIDKQLASLSDDALLGPTPVQLPGRPPSPTSPTSSPPGQKSAPRAAASPQASASAEPKATTSWGVYARLTLSVALGVGMVLWPYPARCGPGLAGYLAAVVVVVTSGIWSSIWTWRHRASHAHTLSLLIILWGLILGSIEVLPRIGYAKPDLRHPIGWACPSGPVVP
ncbi:MAG: putative rane protein [Gemmatimonadetes bacterium]|nr:putative rane protein [Gemmatimonadota bacterium]